MYVEFVEELICCQILRGNVYLKTQKHFFKVVESEYLWTEWNEWQLLVNLKCRPLSSVSEHRMDSDNVQSSHTKTITWFRLKSSGITNFHFSYKFISSVIEIVENKRKLNNNLIVYMIFILGLCRLTPSRPPHVILGFLRLFYVKWYFVYPMQGLLLNFFLILLGCIFVLLGMVRCWRENRSHFHLKMLSHTGWPRKNATPTITNFNEIIDQISECINA